MSWSDRENFLRNASFQGHERIPHYFYISSAYWREAREDMEALCLRHPALFPGFRKGQVNFDDGALPSRHHRTTDAWGCEWEQDLDGLAGIVVGHPLADWARFDSWTPPEPPPFDDAKRRDLEAARARGDLTSCGTEHGFLLMRLYYLRGFENFMMDVASEDPRLDRLVGVVTRYWERVLSPYVEAGVDVLSAADDQGTHPRGRTGGARPARWGQ